MEISIASQQQLAGSGAGAGAGTRLAPRAFGGMVGAPVGVESKSLELLQNGSMMMSSPLQSRLRPNSPQPFLSSSSSSASSSPSSSFSSSSFPSKRAPMTDAPPASSELKAALSTKYPLKHHWVFWHDKYVANTTPDQYTDNLKAIADLDTVQTFWTAYNKILGPEKLTLRCSIHFMHKGVKPLWEDARNEHGGCWKFRVGKADVPVAWRELLMALVGEQFEDCIAPGDEILGLSVSSRWSSDIFQIWNLQSSLKEENNTVMEKVAMILKGIEIQAPFYKAHKDHDDFQK
ncbi:translation initiation factor 4E [Entomortierella parvispora]|uniref:Translation initiation factor 4E n=1 Tax=Entomortierella parvispora TaxID=205924 RepID=A0A9P3HAA3_9FUNG|nr:translation initiation factor 4E [Entomortierella parvispora]